MMIMIIIRQALLNGKYVHWSNDSSMCKMFPILSEEEPNIGLVGWKPDIVSSPAPANIPPTVSYQNWFRNFLFQLLLGQQLVIFIEDFSIF